MGNLNRGNHPDIIKKSLSNLFPEFLSRSLWLSISSKKEPHSGRNCLKQVFFTSEINPSFCKFTIPNIITLLKYFNDRQNLIWLSSVTVCVFLLRVWLMDSLPQCVLSIVFKDIVAVIFPSRSSSQHSPERGQLTDGQKKKPKTKQQEAGRKDRHRNGWASWRRGEYPRQKVFNHTTDASAWWCPNEIFWPRFGSFKQNGTAWNYGTDYLCGISYLVICHSGRESRVTASDRHDLRFVWL